MCSSIAITLIIIINCQAIAPSDMDARNPTTQSYTVRDGGGG
jgi:hypothetical protein